MSDPVLAAQENACYNLLWKQRALFLAKVPWPFESQAEGYVTPANVLVEAKQIVAAINDAAAKAQPPPPEVKRVRAGGLAGCYSSQRRS
jgi:hypothetical protein